LSKKKKNLRAKKAPDKRGTVIARSSKSERKWPAKYIFLGIGILVILVIAGGYFGCQYYTSKNESTSTASTPDSKEGKTMEWSSPPPMSINQNKQYFATIKTNFGDISVQLFPKDAPVTVNNFVFLARQGFYDGLKFHRVVKDFVIQTGDPKGIGSGGPGYKFADEKVTRNYTKGTLAMANSGPNTNGSQFFITLADLSSRLPKNYTIFGEVTGGFDVVQKIGNVPVKASITGESSVPTVDVFMIKVSIEEK